MPTITRLPDEEAAFMERLRAQHNQRPDGLHLTDAIWCNIAGTVKPALTAADIKVRYSDATILRFAEGAMWERALIKGDWRQQYEVGSPDDESTGTIDAVLPRTWFPIEAKTTKRSTLADLPDSTLTQLGGYAARLMLANEKWVGGVTSALTGDTIGWEGEIRTLHKDGDCGKNKCLEHGYPETETRRLNPETKRQKLCCPVCEEFLAGDRQPEMRFYKVVWTRDELLSLHKLLTWRLGELKEDRIAYQGLEKLRGLDGMTFLEIPLPDWKWGYPQTECAGCEVRELVGCPGREDMDEMESEMTGSLTALEGVPA
jgi:hypothetical protein